MIPGAISAEQVERNAGLMRTEVPPDLWAELKREGLMPDAARVPA
jgi:D-threo-aldose 1-dehydrogenase